MSTKITESKKEKTRYTIKMQTNIKKNSIQNFKKVFVL